MFEIKTLSHHAYCLIGNQSLASEIANDISREYKIKTKADSDFIEKSYNILTIDDARELKKLSGIKPVIDGAKKIFILSMNGITVEAQNALLKLLEEPPQYVHFFMIIPSAHLLLPTVKSRLLFIGNEKLTGKANLTEARKFLKANIAQRLEIVKKLIDEIAQEKKSKQDAINFLNDIEKATYEDVGIRKGRKMLEAINLARKYATDRAPSLKMLLEYVALIT
jgi:DNA polymerase III gamma/tau subunit